MIIKEYRKHIMWVSILILGIGVLILLSGAKINHVINDNRCISRFNFEKGIKENCQITYFGIYYPAHSFLFEGVSEHHDIWFIISSKYVDSGEKCYIMYANSSNGAYNSIECPVEEGGKGGFHWDVTKELLANGYILATVDNPKINLTR